MVACGIVAVLALALAACSSDTNGGTPNPSSSESLKIQVNRLGVVAKTSRGTIVVYAYDAAVAATSQATPEAGKRFVAIDAEGCAGPNADEKTGIDPALFYLQDKAEPYYPVPSGVKQPVLHQTSLARGRCARGWVTFEVPEAVTPQYAFFRSASGRFGWLLKS